MALPDLIEIMPLNAPVRAEITVPGSKSITNRALVLAALANGPVTLRGALWSEDTQVMTEALRTLGFEVDVALEADEFCNRTITVRGLGGRIPRKGTQAEPLELFVGNAGTAARFLAALCCLGEGLYRLRGVPRMHERPQAALFAAMRELGYRVDSPNNRLPAVVFGGGAFRGDARKVSGEETGDAVKRVPTSHGGTRSCTVSIEESSQFASALLLCSRTAGWEVSVVGENAEESPYVAMTQRMLGVFPWNGGEFQVEPDASSGSYFWAAGWLCWHEELQRARDSKLAQLGHPPRVGEPMSLGHVQLSDIAVASWPTSRLQVDADFTVFVQAGKASPPSEISRLHDLGDSIMTAIVLAPYAGQSVKFTGLGRLRVQECERVVALRTELTKCGAKVVEEADTLTVYPSGLHGAEIETYNDHRMAMCFAILGLKVPGIRLQNPACVKKTFPNFFQKLATPPPGGVGVQIRDGHTGRKLGLEELFAE